MSTISIVAQIIQYFMINNYNFKVFGEDKDHEQNTHEIKIDGVDIFRNVVARHSETEELTTG